mgnify:CR=1 FL=1
MSWIACTLDDICDKVDGHIQTGPFGSQLHQSDYSEVGTPVVMPKDIVNGTISEEGIARVSEEHVLRLSRHKVRTGDILFSRRGDVGRCAYISPKEQGWLCGTGCLRVTVDAKVADSKFIFYYLQQASAIDWIEKHAIGATMLNLNTGILATVPIMLPSLPTQRRIASILSAYDDLIENNRRQIKLLEEAAQRLYREWFVELRFPGHESVKVVDGVPEGWMKVCLKDICETKTGKKDANFGCDDGAYPFFTCAQAPIKAPSYSFDCSAVILAGNGDFNVKLYRGKFEAYQRTYVLSPANTEYLFLLYNAVRRNMNVLTKGASGSTIKFLTKGMIDSIDLLIPSSQLLTTYNQNSEALQKSIEVLRRKIALAVEARDRLLPRLMNHEMEVML